MVHEIDLLMDELIEMIDRFESQVCQVVAFEVAPAPLDIVEFGGVFQQPLDGQPARTSWPCWCGWGRCRERGRPFLPVCRRPVHGPDRGLRGKR